MKKRSILKEDTIAQALQKNPRAGEILLREGLMCVGCGMAYFETIEQGCKLHGLPIDTVLKKLNASSASRAGTLKKGKKSSVAKTHKKR